MSFADWKKRSRLIAEIHWIYQGDAERACQAAYKAGERQGRKDAKQVAMRAIELTSALQRKSKNELPNQK